MVDKKKVGLKALTDIRRFAPSPRDLLKPFPSPQKTDLVLKGVTADVLGYAFGYIPTVGDLIGQFANDNIMADVFTKMTAAELEEFRAQNRVYPNGVALLRTFQRISAVPGGK
jgi:hypothetical protein